MFDPMKPVMPDTRRSAETKVREMSMSTSDMMSNDNHDEKGRFSSGGDSGKVADTHVDAANKAVIAAKKGDNGWDARQTIQSQGWHKVGNSSFRGGNVSVHEHDDHPGTQVLVNGSRGRPSAWSREKK